VENLKGCIDKDQGEWNNNGKFVQWNGKHMNLEQWRTQLNKTTDPISLIG